MRLATVLGLLGGLLGPGCVTPSIPIPPPDVALMTFDVSAVGSGSDAVTEATFEYPANPSYVDSTVYVFDQNRGDGVIETASPTGGFLQTQPFAATLGDQVIVTVQHDDQSESACVVLQDGLQNPNVPCQ